MGKLKRSPLEPMDPGLAKLLSFNQKTLEANRSGHLHKEQLQFLLSSPHFQALFNICVALTAIAYLTWSWSKDYPTGLVGPLACLLAAIAGANALRHSRTWLRFKREAPDIALNISEGFVQLEKLSHGKRRTRGARKLKVGAEEFLVTKGIHQKLQAAEGQKMRLYWCREPVHQRKHILSAEFLPKS